MFHKIMYIEDHAILINKWYVFNNQSSINEWNFDVV